MRSLPELSVRSTPSRVRAVPILLALLVAVPPAGAQESPTNLDEAVQTITAGSVRSHLEFLASDALRGRDTPSPGLAAAAEYLETRHRANGLEPAGVEGSYLQHFSLRGGVPDPASDPANVLAMLRGSDPQLRDEYIVLSAHYDHVGVGPPVAGDSIYNGADDNASGTAALLEIARVLASLPEGERPRRTVVFTHVSGEESGLLGSRWWTDHPTVPIERVVANLNTDMIGGTTHADTVAALGREYSSLGPLIARVGRDHPDLGVETVGDIWPGERLFFRSDQYNFMRLGIPSLFFFAGFHDCYHRPCDEVELVSADKVARVARLLTYVILEIADTEEPPTWNPGAWDEVQRIITQG